MSFQKTLSFLNKTELKQQLRCEKAKMAAADKKDEVEEYKSKILIIEKELLRR